MAHQGGKTRERKTNYTPRSGGEDRGELMANAPISLIGLYNSIYGPQGEPFPAHLLPIAAALMDARIEKLMMICGPGSGKALRNSTPVLTDTGWKPIFEITLNDKVILPDGKNTSKVIGILPQDASLLYKVSFSDGRSVFCHANHLWGVYCGNGPGLRVLETFDLAEKLEKGIKVRVPLCKEINYDTTHGSEVLAYIWGACAAIGLFESGSRVMLYTHDKDFLAGIRVFKVPGVSIARIPEGALIVFESEELVPRLNEIEIFKLNAAWRKSFIAGFLDAGNTKTDATGIKLYFPNFNPLKAVQRILWSLGVSVHLLENSDKSDESEKFILSLKPPFNPFFNTRKTSKFHHHFKIPSTAKKLLIQSIELQEIPELSTCICIEDPEGLFITQDYIVTHNSRLLLGLFPAWMIGVDPTSSFIAISAGEGLPQTFMRTVMQIVESSPHFRRAFPDVRPDKEIGWSTKTGLYVTGRAIGDSKASYFAAGVDSSMLTGLHANHLIFDDLHDKDNAYNTEQRKKLVDTYYNTLLHRSVAKGTRYIMSGRRWAEDDILGHLLESGDWVVLTLPAERAGDPNLYYDVIVPHGKDCIFTDPGQALEIEATAEQKAKGLRAFKAYYGNDPQGEGFYWPEHPTKRSEWNVIKRNSPDIAESVYQCRPGQRSGSIFMPDSFSYFSLDVPELNPHILPDSLKGQKIIQSWDTSHGRLSSNAYSACLTGILIPCHDWHKGENATLIGPAEPHLDLYIVDAYKAKLAIDELLHKIRQKHLFWQASQVLIEEKASGIPALQILPTAGCPITPTKAWTSKRGRAIESIDGGTSSVQGWFKLGRVHFWAEAPWLPDLEAELKNFTGDNTGYKDQVDALVYLVSQAIKLSAGRITMSSITPVPASETLAKAELMASSSDANVWQQLEAINQALSMPPEETQFCISCKNLQANNFCALQQRKVSNLDSCIDWESKTLRPRSGQIILPSNISMFGGFNFG